MVCCVLCSAWSVLYCVAHGQSSQWRTEVGLGGINPLPEIPKALQNRAKLSPIVLAVNVAEFRTPTPQDIRKKGSKILKLPSVRDCFTLAMTNSLS